MDAIVTAILSKGKGRGKGRTETITIQASGTEENIRKLAPQILGNCRITSIKEIEAQAA